MRGILILALVVVWLGAVYYGFVRLIGHAMNASHPQYKVFHSQDQFSNQQQKVQEQKQRQKDLMEDRQFDMRMQQGRF